MMLIVIALLALVLLAIVFPAFNRGTFLLLLVLGELAFGPILDNSPSMMLIVIAMLVSMLLAILSHSLYEGARRDISPPSHIISVEGISWRRPTFAALAGFVRLHGR
jgi:hypothetical protein